MSLSRRLWSLAGYQFRLRLGLVQGAGFGSGTSRGRAGRLTLRLELFEWLRYEELVFRPSPADPGPTPHPLARECALLGAAVGTDLLTVRACWRQRVRQTHPDLFPAGSAEQRQASERLRQFNECYERLRAHLE